MKLLLTHISFQCLGLTGLLVLIYYHGRKHMLLLTELLNCIKSDYITSKIYVAVNDYFECSAVTILCYCYIQYAYINNVNTSTTVYLF